MQKNSSAFMKIIKKPMLLFFTV